MIIDLRKPYQWDEINEAVKAATQFEGTAKIFQSVSQAIFEIAMSVQNLYAHKKQFYYSLGFGTHADEGILYLARQGTKGIEFPADQPPTIEDKKTLFWLCDLDDALTGQLYQDEATSSLDPKIFRIGVSHRTHFTQAPQKSIGDNDIRIYAADSGPVIAHFGKRAQSLQMLLAPTLKWDHLAPFKGFEVRPEQKNAIEALEASSLAGAKAFFNAPVPRLYDRALLVWNEWDAGALREILIRDHQVPAPLIETVGLSRWNEPKLIAQFEKRGLSNETFRGLLILSAALTTETKLAQKITSAVVQLQKISQF